ncbi:MGDG synthase family glycosyltransferase [Metabacillus idriensis]|uniref:MGDG synthase family glycosyltransferase n=1 Tax=Metabacillus idriensis TaxID=324768 RepID=UPI00174AD0B9|nr:glycosyltransferase [Metabacillus idriensis]
MKKVLFLPLFTMNSGHHQAASALMEAFSRENPSIICEKIDFLSYVSKPLEHVISTQYLNGIKYFSGSYNTFYKHFFKKTSRVMQYTYELLFLEKMEMLITQKQPDLIICTHSFPSFLISKLKEYGVCEIPVINCYTDFFKNSLWGGERIDWHFVPSADFKQQLIEESVSPDQIVITGILTNDAFKRKKREKRINKEKLHVLIAGGSQGVGDHFSLLDKVEESVEYRVLCGSNHQLYQKLSELKSSSIIPLSYISSPQTMNELYDWADVLVTKPGGVTTSEALKKNLPIFVHSVLPGQEEINVEYLQEKGFIYRLNDEEPLIQQIQAKLDNEAMAFKMRKNSNQYFDEMEVQSNTDLFHFIEDRMMNDAKVQDARLDLIFSKIYSTLMR